jgi:tripartite-type tricarboxylate transporter receptor subunit TctC
MRPLAVTTEKRSQFFPELPTMDEAGVKGYAFSTWYMLVVPTGVPAPTMRRLNEALAQVLRSDVVKSQFAAQGLEPTPSSAAEASRYLKSEIAKWGKVIRASGARPE